MSIIYGYGKHFRPSISRRFCMAGGMESMKWRFCSKYPRKPYAPSTCSVRNKTKRLSCSTKWRTEGTSV